MNAETQSLSEAACLIVEYAEKQGAQNIKDLPGAWFHQIDEKWAIAVNGHKTPMHVGPKDGMDIDLNPFCFAVWRNGWLFGLLSAFGGVFMGEDGAGEDEFIAEIKKHL